MVGARSRVWRISRGNRDKMDAMNWEEKGKSGSEDDVVDGVHGEEENRGFTGVVAVAGLTGIVAAFA